MQNIINQEIIVLQPLSTIVNKTYYLIRIINFFSCVHMLVSSTQDLDNFHVSGHWVGMSYSWPQYFFIFILIPGFKG
jgi:hypothetical protein